jgi:hypothetical protein
LGQNTKQLGNAFKELKNRLGNPWDSSRGPNAVLAVVRLGSLWATPGCAMQPWESLGFPLELDAVWAVLGIYGKDIELDMRSGGLDSNENEDRKWEK